MNIRFPYGRAALTVDLPEEKVVGEFGPVPRQAAPDPSACIERALAAPIGSRSLEEVIRPHCSVAITVEDITRTVPNHLILPPLLRILRDGGVDYADITILIATGLHRPPSEKEAADLLGDIPRGVDVKNHDAYRSEELTYVGTTSQGTPLHINTAFVRAEVKIVTCDVEFHQIMGYGGGAKSVLPGLCDAATVCRTHSRLAHENASAGILDGNPARAEVDEAGRMVGVDFCVNVVLNSGGHIIDAFCGDIIESFRTAARLVDEVYGVRVPRRFGMVLVDCGGYPRDINLYQAQKSVENAVKMVEPGGSVVLIAECAEGWGSTAFERWASEVTDLREVKDEMRRNFSMGKHKLYEFALERDVAKLYLISRLREPSLAKFIVPISPAELIEMVRAEPEVAVLHHGTNALPVLP